MNAIAKILVHNPHGKPSYTLFSHDTMNAMKKTSEFWIRRPSIVDEFHFDCICRSYNEYGFTYACS